MSKKIFYAEVDSPNPTSAWFDLNDGERIERINQAIDQINPEFSKQLLAVAAKEDGQVVVRMLNPLSALERGSLLLNFEEYIKNHIDQGLTVWCEALGDKNSLRNLRGIEVKIS